VRYIARATQAKTLSEFYLRRETQYVKEEEAATPPPLAQGFHILEPCPENLFFRVNCAHGPSSFAVASLLHVGTRENKKITRR
jgi:hypothetical protein